MTLREVIDLFEGKPANDPVIVKLLTDTGSEVPTKSFQDTNGDLAHIKGLVWRKDGKVTVNADRPFIPNLDDLPTPLHNLLPLQRYRGPMMKGAYSFVVPSRGCSAGCIYCIKHVSYQWSLRLRSPENIMQELRLLKSLGINYVQFYADLFTLSRAGRGSVQSDDRREHRHALDVQQPRRLRG